MDANTVHAVLVVLTVFVGVTTIAFILQLIVLFGLGKAIRESSQRLEGIANRIEERTTPVMAAAQAILEEAQPRVGEITGNLVEASELIRNNVAEVSAATGEIVERARGQIARLDELVHSTADKVAQTTEFLQQKVISPVRRIHALISAVKAGITFLRRAHSLNESHSAALDEDEEMFI